MQRMIKSFIALAILTVIGAVTAYASLYGWFHSVSQVDFQLNQRLALNVPEDLNSAEVRLFEVRRGMHRHSIANDLSELGWVQSAWFNALGFRLFIGDSVIQAGIYPVYHGDTPNQIWQRIIKGEQFLFSMTFIEGSEFRHWQAQLAEHPFVRIEYTEEKFSQLLAEFGGEYSHPEGLLFPDTYRFFAGTTDLRLYRQAYQRMQSVLSDAWEHRDRSVPLTSPYEALILASIVERETGAANERGLVASVFVNRLRAGMRLQSDPTIIYGLGDRYRGVIYRSDIQEHTPWNTYRIHGLPPTPIAMPGAAAIRATLQPDDSDYFYFVSRNDGTHVFSRTLTEHNRAVQTYQRNR